MEHSFITTSIACWHQSILNGVAFKVSYYLLKNSFITLFIRHYIVKAQKFWHSGFRDVRQGYHVVWCNICLTGVTFCISMMICWKGFFDTCFDSFEIRSVLVLTMSLSHLFSSVLIECSLQFCSLTRFCSDFSLKQVAQCWHIVVFGHSVISLSLSFVLFWCYALYRICSEQTTFLDRQSLNSRFFFFKSAVCYYSFQNLIDLYVCLCMCVTVYTF